MTRSARNWSTGPAAPLKANLADYEISGSAVRANARRLAPRCTPARALRRLARECQNLIQINERSAEGGTFCFEF